MPSDISEGINALRNVLKTYRSDTMRKVAYIGIKFEEHHEIRNFNLNLPYNTEILSCRRIIKGKYNFLQLCYAFYVENLEDEVTKWENFKFFIVSKNFENFDSTNLTFINDIKVNTSEFKIYYK